jgi:precorrin-4/cobalt-precorrin-4 C11-methyltransferase
MTGRLYFLGAGPGAPDLLTLRACRALEESQLVFVAEPYDQIFAELLVGKDVRIPFSYYFAELIAEIETHLKIGNVAFLIPGDLTFYSPFQAIIDHFSDESIVVPGVGTANAASASLKKTFDLPGVCNRAIIASPRTLGDDNAPSIRDLAAPGVALLIYMNNLPLDQLVADLFAGYGENVPIAILHRLCLPGEEVVAGTLDTIVAQVADRDFFNLNTRDKRPALTLVVVGKTLEASVDGSWWDYRREHIWRFRDGDKP